MVIICQNIFKVVIQVIAKFALSLHFLLLISFMFLHFLPGSFIEDEFIVADKALGKKDFFFELKNYLSHVYHFNFGNSYAHPQTTVLEIISDRYLTSIKLILYSFAFILVSSLMLSFCSLLFKGFHKVLKKVFIVVNAIPLIVVLPSLIYIFYYILAVIPARFNSENKGSFIFTVFLISFKFVFQLTELILNRWILESRNQYNQTAKAKGLSRFQVYIKHSFRNIIPSVISFSQNVFLSLIAGNFLVESFYSIPGIGLTFVEAMSNRDLPLIMASVLVLGCLYFIVNSISELLIRLLYIFQQKEIV